MNKNKIEEDPISTWDKMVHAPFKKIVEFDLVCIGIGMLLALELAHLSSRKY